MKNGRAETTRLSDRTATADDEAVQQGLRAVDHQRADEGERIARDVLARHPHHPGALHLLGVALVAQKRPREAIAPLDEAARSISDPVFEAHLAVALRDAGRSAEALTWLQRASARQPPSVVALLELGILLCALRRFTEAEAVLRRGLEVAPTVPELSMELGGVYLNRADPANAKIAFARALAQAPGHPRALQGFGTALLYERDFERAAVRFRQVLAREPGHVRARLDLAHCLLELGNWDEAVACLRATVAAAPRLYGRALRTLASSGRGRFWLRRSAAAAFLDSNATAAPTASATAP